MFYLEIFNSYYIKVIFTSFVETKVRLNPLIQIWYIQIVNPQKNQVIPMNIW